MKTIGIIGGIGPESTIDYYRRLLAGAKKRTQDGDAPAIIINSIDVRKLLRLIATNQVNVVADYLITELDRLARAGAQCGMLAANTPHVVFDEVSRRSPVPLVSIVTATCGEAKSRGLKKLGLFGTKFTMQGRFYAEAFASQGLCLAVPLAEEQDYIHDKYVNELIPGKYVPETRDRMLAIAARMREKDGIHALILGGTELPLLLNDSALVGIPFLDTTQIHVDAVLKAALG